MGPCAGRSIAWLREDTALPSSPGYGANATTDTLNFWGPLAEKATRSQTGSILTYLLAHRRGLSVGMSLGRQAFGGSTCRINPQSSLHMAFGPMGHVTARSFRCFWPMAF